MKKIFLDTETTGLDPKKHGIVSLHYILEDSKGNYLTEGEIVMNTFKYTKLYTPKALEINGYAVDDIKGFQDPREALQQFDEALMKYSEGERYQIVAYNAKFDKDMLEALYNYYIPGRFWKVLTHKVLDTLQLVLFFQELGIIDTGKSQNLESAAKYFDIEHLAHNVVSDNKAQHYIYKHIMQSIKEGLINEQN